MKHFGLKEICNKQKRVEFWRNIVIISVSVYADRSPRNSNSQKSFRSTFYWGQGRKVEKNHKVLCSQWIWNLRKLKYNNFTEFLLSRAKLKFKLDVEGDFYNCYCFPQSFQQWWPATSSHSWRLLHFTCGSFIWGLSRYFSFVLILFVRLFCFEFCFSIDWGGRARSRNQRLISKWSKELLQVFWNYRPSFTS